MGLLVVNSDYERLYGVSETPPEPTREELTQMYLTFEALEDGSIGVNIPSGVGTSLVTSVSYSIDEGETWTTTNNVDSTEINIVVDNVKKGDKILWKGSATSYSTTGSSTKNLQFISLGNIDIYGNIMSLLYGDDFIDYVKLTATSVFKNLFNKLKVVNAKGLVLPSILSYGCYQSMFFGCDSLTTAPELPATTLRPSCYNSMFTGCDSLTTAPELPATTLTESCYAYMFNGCDSLTTAPELPALTLASNCYNSMFEGCISLTTAPELPATTLANKCYNRMFHLCTSLNYIKMLASTVSSSNMTEWVTEVSPTGTFVKASGVEISTGTSGIPSGWTVEEV